MKILLTGATGYIGKRLLIQLLEEGHHVVCSVRDQNRFSLRLFKERLTQIEVIENDFLEESTLNNIPKDIDAAYYLIHSMSSSEGDFQEKEKISAENFRKALEKTAVKQVIFLTGIINEEKLSKHLQSRKNVEKALKSSVYSLTSLRAGIIVGSGSASFEIIRDLVEKLPVMITPKWLNTKCQPIAIRNVMQFLVGVLGQEFTYNQNYDIAGTDIVTYKQMLLQYAEIRGLKRHIFIVPVMTPQLSSYWLYFVTSTSYFLAKNLVHSMKIDVVANENNLAEQLDIHLFLIMRRSTRLLIKSNRMTFYRVGLILLAISFTVDKFGNIWKFQRKAVSKTFARKKWTMKKKHLTVFLALEVKQVGITLIFFGEFVVFLINCSVA